MHTWYINYYFIKFRIKEVAIIANIKSLEVKFKSKINPHKVLCGEECQEIVTQTSIKWWSFSFGQ